MGIFVSGFVALAAVALIIVLITGTGSRRFLRWRKRKDAVAESVRCLRCGYSLDNLEVPRCPECGTLRGFEVPMQELGLTEDDLKGRSSRGSTQTESTSSADQPGGVAPSADRPKTPSSRNGGASSDSRDQTEP
jgi:hypothetical protein